MEGPKKMPLSSEEMVATQERFRQERIQREKEAQGIFSKYPGFVESLDILTNYNRSDEKPAYSYEQIVKILATDKEARDVMKNVEFSHDDSEAINGFYDKLGWSLVDELASRLGQR